MDNIDKAITKRLNLMRERLKLHKARPYRRLFRVREVNGIDHHFILERFLSDYEIINQILIKLEYPRDYIPQKVRNDLEAQHSPYDTIYANGNADSVFNWFFNYIHREIRNIILAEFGRLSPQKETDAEELFETARTLRELREFKRGLHEIPLNNHAKRSPLLNDEKRNPLPNLPEEGPANLVSRFITGEHRNGGLRPGKHTILIAEQEKALLAKLIPKIPEIGDVKLPYIYPFRTRTEYERDAYVYYYKWIDDMLKRDRERRAFPQIDQQLYLKQLAERIAQVAQQRALPYQQQALPAQQPALPAQQPQPRGLCNIMKNGLMRCFRKKRTKKNRSRGTRRVR
jgi:hypothetical protein